MSSEKPVPKMFAFDPARYTEKFARHGYVHIRKGLDEEFLAGLTRQADAYVAGSLRGEFAIGDKQQAIYEFHGDGEAYLRELFATVGAICSLAPEKMTLSERHIKAYDADASPRPLAHKDRLASEISIGFSIRIPTGSSLILYPYDELEVNPFNSSSENRASLTPDRLPEPALEKARRVTIQDASGDVVMFRGRAMWHMRYDAAGSTLLYLKLNTFNADPLAEDPRHRERVQLLKAALASSDEALQSWVPLLGSRVDYLQRRYGRDGREVIGAVLWKDHHLTLDEDELTALQRMDGSRSLGEVLADIPTMTAQSAMDSVRRLAAAGVIDLRPPSGDRASDSGKAGTTEQPRDR